MNPLQPTCTKPVMRTTSQTEEPVKTTTPQTEEPVLTTTPQTWKPILTTFPQTGENGLDTSMILGIIIGVIALLVLITLLLLVKRDNSQNQSKFTNPDIK